MSVNPAVSAPDNPSPLTHPAAERRTRWSSVLSGSIFASIHLIFLAIPFVGFPTSSAWIMALTYGIGMFAVTAGYHRYFSHRTYKTGRVFQFVLAWLAQSSAQKGALWWAAHHRHHHRHSDQPTDIHSPVQRGFWYSHVGWLFDGTDATDYRRVRDLARYPELVWLNRWFLVPPLVTGTLIWLVFDWAGLVAYVSGLVVLFHGTFTINSLSHVFGSRRFETDDDSRNNWLLALITFGEGWHNNHHRFPSSARQGFYWWEYDLTWMLLNVLSWFGLVWDLRPAPAHLLER